jgi:hypothetical protein
MLIGAFVIAFTGREKPQPLPVGAPPAAGTAGPGAAAGQGAAAAAAGATIVAPLAVRRRRARAGLDRWEHGVPLNPTKRELARRRAGVGTPGVSAERWFGGEPEA